MNRTVIFGCGLLTISALVSEAQNLRAYSHGNPTADEQYMLELINRARAAPDAEGRFLAGINSPDIKVGFDYYKVDLNRLRQDFAGYAARPPIAFNPTLIEVARRHSNDMARRNFQSHTGSEGSTMGSRMLDAGYFFILANESIYSNLVPSALFAHVGLNVDWGPFANGVQPDLGHRRNIMGFGGQDFKEVGIGIVTRTGASADKYGKLSITQDYGNRTDAPDFLVGVAYYDLNLNGIYDPGEGIPGVQVTPDLGGYYAVTSQSGGYAIPFSTPPGASYVTFSGGGLPAPITQPFTLTGGNAKADLRLTVGVEQVKVKLGKVDSVAKESGPASGKTAIFRVFRTGSTSGTLKVDLSRTIRNAKGKAVPADYKLSVVRPATATLPAKGSDRFTVVIPSGSDHADIKLTAVSDKQTEPKETVAFGLLTSKNYQRGTPTAMKISITK